MHTIFVFLGLGYLTHDYFLFNFFHLPADFMMSFILTAEWCSIVQMNIFYIHYFGEEFLGCFQFIIIKRAVMNKVQQESVWWDKPSFLYMSKSGMAGLK